MSFISLSSQGRLSIKIHRKKLKNIFSNKAALYPIIKLDGSIFLGGEKKKLEEKNNFKFTLRMFFTVKNQY